MKKIRTYAAVVSIIASAGLLAACGDNETDSVTDTGGVTEAPVTQTPPAETPAPSATDTPATTPAPAATDTPAATTPPASGDDSATDITPEPDTQ